MRNSGSVTGAKETVAERRPADVAAHDPAEGHALRDRGPDVVLLGDLARHGQRQPQAHAGQRRGQDQPRDEQRAQPRPRIRERRGPARRGVEEEGDGEDPKYGIEEVQQRETHEVHGRAVGQYGSRLQRAGPQRPRVPGAPQPTQDADDDADDDRPGQQPDVGCHSALPHVPEGRASAAGPGGGPGSAGRIEIRPQDPQPTVDDDGHGNQDDRGERDASCETSHWRIMAQAWRMCRYSALAPFSASMGTTGCGARPGTGSPCRAACAWAGGA